MMTAESMLSKRPGSRFTVALFFLLKESRLLTYNAVSNVRKMSSVFM